MINSVLLIVISSGFWFGHACCSYLVAAPEEIEINPEDFDHFFGLDTYSMLNHQVGELVSIDEHKALITNAVGEADGISSEFAGGDNDSLPATA